MAIDCTVNWVSGTVGTYTGKLDGDSKIKRIVLDRDSKFVFGVVREGNHLIELGQLGTWKFVTAQKFKLQLEIKEDVEGYPPFDPTHARLSKENVLLAAEGRSPEAPLVLDALVGVCGAVLTYLVYSYTRSYAANTLWDAGQTAIIATFGPVK